jgi:histidine phosphotransfer protein HptB
MSTPQETTVIDWARFSQARAALGHNFWRVLGYFREDGGKAVSAIEEGLRGHNALAMIGPADLLKSEAVQMGALAVAELAEEIEMQARDCVEMHQSPAILLESVVRLRAVFERTTAAFDHNASPLVTRDPRAIKRPLALSTL